MYMHANPHTRCQNISICIYTHSIYSICSFFLQHTYTAENNYCGKKNRILTEDKLSSENKNIGNLGVTNFHLLLPLLKCAREA